MIEARRIEIDREEDGRVIAEIIDLPVIGLPGVVALLDEGEMGPRLIDRFARRAFGGDRPDRG